MLSQTFIWGRIKKNIAPSVIPFPPSSAEGRILLQLEYFFFTSFSCLFFSRILHWLAHRNDFKVQINVFICWRLKYFLYLYPLTDQIRASPAVCGAAIDEAPIVLNASHQKSFLSYNDMLHKDKEQAFSSHEELKKKQNSNPRPIASYIVSCLFEGIR